MKTIVLASSSPRRQQLLRTIGLTFVVDSSEIPEVMELTNDPVQLARNLSIRKAESVAARHKGALVIAADTIGVIDGRIIGKPKTEADAVHMLTLLSGRCHTVITGLAIIDTDTGARTIRSVETIVCFRDLTREEIESYVRTGEPMGKAGSYAIQGLGALLVDRIDGDYYNVMGLPLSALARALKEFGIDVLMQPSSPG